MYLKSIYACVCLYVCEGESEYERVCASMYAPYKPYGCTEYVSSVSAPPCYAHTVNTGSTPAVCCIYMHVCIYIYIYICVYVCVLVCICVCVCMHVCV